MGKWFYIVEAQFHRARDSLDHHSLLFSLVAYIRHILEQQTNAIAPLIHRTYLCRVWSNQPIYYRNYRYP